MFLSFSSFPDWEGRFSLVLGLLRNGTSKFLPVDVSEMRFSDIKHLLSSSFWIWCNMCLTSCLFWLQMAFHYVHYRKFQLYKVSRTIKLDSITKLKCYDFWDHNCERSWEICNLDVPSATHTSKRVRVERSPRLNNKLTMNQNLSKRKSFIIY